MRDEKSELFILFPLLHSFLPRDGAEEQKNIFILFLVFHFAARAVKNWKKKLFFLSEFWLSVGSTSPLYCRHPPLEHSNNNLSSHSWKGFFIRNFPPETRNFFFLFDILTYSLFLAWFILLNSHYFLRWAVRNCHIISTHPLYCTKLFFPMINFTHSVSLFICVWIVCDSPRSRLSNVKQEK